MNRIVQVSCQDFKGLDGTFPLESRTIITGPNGSGKSALFEAIRFVVEGHTSLGRTHESTGKLLGAVGGRVQVLLESGHVISRSLNVDRRSQSYSMQTMIDGVRMSNKDAEIKIAELIGSFAPMLDLGAFMDLSTDNRRKSVLDWCATTEKDSASVGVLSRAIADYCHARLNLDVDAASPEEIDAARRQLPKAEQKGLTSFLDLLSKETVDLKSQARAVATLIESSRQISLRAKRDLDEARNAARHMAGRSTQVGSSGASFADLQAQIKKAQAEAGAIREQIGTQDGRKTARESLVQQIEQCEQYLQRDSRQIEQLQEAVRQGRSELDSLDKEIAPLTEKAHTGPDLADLQRDADEALKAVDAAKTAREGIPRPDPDWAELHGLLHRAEIEAVVNSSNHNDIGEILVLVRDVVGRHYPGESEAYDKADADFRAASKKSGDLHKLFADKAAKLALFDTLAAKRTKLDGETEGAAKALATRTKEKDEHEHRLIELRRKLDELDSSHGTVPVEQLREQHDSLQQHIREVQTQLDEKNQQAARQKEHLACQDRIDSNEALWTVGKGMIDALGSVRRAILSEMITPFLDPMKKFLARTGFAVQPYCALEDERGKEVFEIGVVNEDRHVPYEALSGGERALVGAALVVSLLEAVNPPLPLLMVEAGEADQNVLAAILNAAQQCELGNMLVATWVQFALPGWATLDMAATSKAGD